MVVGGFELVEEGEDGVDVAGVEEFTDLTGFPSSSWSGCTISCSINGFNSGPLVSGFGFFETFGNFFKNSGYFGMGDFDFVIVGEGVQVRSWRYAVLWKALREDCGS
jgi:hypothetical protein